MNNTEPKEMPKITQPPKTKKKTPRCHLDECKKKLKLTDMKCSCGHIFCSKHRSKPHHNCSEGFPIKDAFINKCGLGGGICKKIDVL